MHIWHQSHTIDMSYGRSAADIKAIFADAMLCINIVGPDKLNLPNCSFFWD